MIDVGDIVKIKKGTLVKVAGTPPKPAGSTHRVKVRLIKLDTIIYTGSDGYWREVDIKDVE